MSSYKIINPYSNEPIAEINYTNEEDALKALTLLDSGRNIQKKMAPFERAQILTNLADLMKRDRFI